MDIPDNLIWLAFAYLAVLAGLAFFSGYQANVPGRAVNSVLPGVILAFWFVVPIVISVSGHGKYYQLSLILLMVAAPLFLLGAHVAYQRR